MRRAPQRWGRADASDDLGLRYSHPEWLCRRWIHAWGPEAVEGAFAADQQPAPTWVWFRDESAQDQIRSRGIDLIPHPWVPNAWRAEGNQLIAAVAERYAYVQDPASQLVAHVSVALGRPGATLLDLCAAPGGKTARAARFGQWANVAACDRHLGRLRLARRLYSATGVAAHAVAQDGLQPAVLDGTWSVVLLDAPCTGTGTLRRHPELRWRLRPEDLDDRAKLQRGLIDSALALVRPGGVLLYSTCSVEPEENEQHFEVVPPGFELVGLEDALPPRTPAVTTSCGGVLLRPQELCDGFTMHAIRKVV